VSQGRRAIANCTRTYQGCFENKAQMRERLSGFDGATVTPGA
jgi:hypothetical protein